MASHTESPVQGGLERLKRSFSASGLSSRRNWWIFPLVVAGVLSVVGWWIRTGVEAELMKSVAEQLSTIRDADVEALKIWLKSQERNVVQAAESRRVSSWAVNLIDMSPTVKPHELFESGAHAQLVASLEPWLSDEKFQGFALLNRDWKIVASTHEELVGKVAPSEYGVFLDPAFSGRPTVSRPFPSLVMLPDEFDVLRAGVPTMYAAAPVHENGVVVGVLALRIRPELDFTRLLQVGQMGATGETYAFDQEGLLLSESRFDKKLKATGLIPDQSVSRSILMLKLKDPGVDLMKGKRPQLDRDQLPLTVPVASAIQTKAPGSNVDGYRDYLGEPSVGAWTWIDEYGFGVNTEVTYDEAFRAVTVVRRMFWGLLALLGLSFIAIVFVTWLLARWQRTAQQAVLAARQLGQYTLDPKEIGSGGMGTVYRAHHAMLRRPTAVKLLNVERTNETTLKRFEREVQLTSQLNHPNTVAIYDFGRTPEGIFYYAMEFLDGLTLHDLVVRFGPQPPGRVISILRQICGSLAEAHDLGLIHRDIKPANVLINHRGGMFDVVKVVDFGLVKDTTGAQVNLTHANAITGTPMYMAPESIEKGDLVDQRVDLYAVGGVGYFLLTGTAMFLSDSLFDLLRLQSSVTPDSPSTRLGRDVATDLEEVIMTCLAKSPADRPQTARDLERRLAACADVDSWTFEEAQEWWKAYEAKSRPAETQPETSTHEQGATMLLPNTPSVENREQITRDGTKTQS